MAPICQHHKVFLHNLPTLEYKLALLRLHTQNLSTQPNLHPKSLRTLPQPPVQIHAMISANPLPELLLDICETVLDLDLQVLRIDETKNLKVYGPRPVEVKAPPPQHTVPVRRDEDGGADLILERTLLVDGNSVASAEQGYRGAEASNASAYDTNVHGVVLWCTVM